jgi:DNA-binding response OmpR family regulator
MNNTILLIEDNPFVVQSIKQILPKQYTLHVRKDLSSSYSYLEATKPSLILLDRTLPDGDGIELAEYVADTDRTSPLVIISGKAMLHDRIEGLRKGADDYLSKPFSTAELMLKVEKLLRTTKHHEGGVIEYGSLKLLVDRGQVLIGDHLLRLRRREFQILAYLVAQKGRVITRGQLIEHIWPDGVTPSFATIDVYIRRLRMMLGNYGKIITTVKGFGYSVQERQFQALPSA